MEKITDLPLGEKFVRQSSELTAINVKLDRGNLKPSHREALVAHRLIVSQAINRTLDRMSATQSA